MDADTSSLLNDAAVEVLSWRLDTLERAGYSSAVALELAARVDIDLHRAVELVLAGCSPELALKILI
jgi:hypothetical protein